jgi:Fe-S-cluster-containing dehydrogenase component
MARMKFLCDADRCIECNACVTACGSWLLQRPDDFEALNKKADRGCASPSTLMPQPHMEVQACG